MIFAGSWSARAQSPEPAQLFNEGRQAMRQNNYQQACLKFEESQRLSPAQGTLLNLALCREALGRLVQAEADLRAFLQNAPSADPRRSIALEHLRAVEASAPRLTVTIKGPPDAANVQVDGTRLSPDRLGVPIAVDPGRHTISVSSEPGTINETSIDLKSINIALRAGDAAAVAAETGGRSPAPELLEAPKQQSVVTRRRAWGHVAAGAGVASLATGLLAGAFAWREKGIMEEHCGADGCDSDGLAAARSGSRLSFISTVSCSLGLLGLAITGVSLFMSGAQESASPELLDRP